MTRLVPSERTRPDLDPAKQNRASARVRSTPAPAAPAKASTVKKHGMFAVLVRRRLGFTQAQLAGVLGVHVMTVSKWERYELQPAGLQRLLLVAFLDVPKGVGVEAAQELERRGPIAALRVLLSEAR